MAESESMVNSSTGKAWTDSHRGRFLVAAGMMGLFVLVFCLAMKSRQMLSTQPPLVVDEQYLSFGEVWEDPAFGWTLPIRNTTEEEIAIAGFAISCPCAKIEPPSLTILPQVTAEVHLTLDLLSPPTSKPDFTGREFKVTIQPRINKGTVLPLGWVVQGKVKHPFAIDPTVVDFQESLVRGEPFLPRLTTIMCGLDLAELTAHCDVPFLTAKATRDTKNPQRFQLEVQVRNEIAGGPFKHQVRLLALTPDKKKLSGTIPVIGRVLEDVALQPERLSFAAVPIGTKLRETVTLSSRSGQDFAIEEIDKGGRTSIAIEVHRKRKDGSQSFDVSFSVEHLGQEAYTLLVKVKTPRGLLDLPLRIGYCGISAE